MNLTKISQLLAEIFKKLLGIKKELSNLETTNGRKLYKFVKEHLGESFVSDIDWDGDIDEKDFEVGCCISFWNIFEKTLGYIMTMNLSTSIKISTHKTYKIFESNQDKFKPIKPHDIRKGDIIISPSGYQAGGKTGHIGIFTDKLKIASNNSYGELVGKFTENYKLDTWVKNWNYTRIFRVL